MCSSDLSRRLNPAGVHQFGRTRSNDPPGGNQTHQAGHSTQPNFSSHQAQSTTGIACTANPAPYPWENLHSTIRTCRPKCRLQNNSTFTPRGAHVHMHAANGKPELNVAIWTRCESNQSCGGAHRRFPRAVSALIMDLADKDFSSFGTSRPQNQNPSLPLVPSSC